MTEQLTLFEMPEPVRQTAPAITSEGDSVHLGRHLLRCDDCLSVMVKMESESVDSIVTDPPYGINFNGSHWDSSVPGLAWAQECFRVLKPGGHIVAFSANRTLHKLTTALEDSGFEVRDIISWLQWQGFPKSHDVGKAIDRAAGALDERKVIGKSQRHNSIALSDIVNPQGKGGIPDITAPATPEAARWDGWGSGLKPASEPAILCRKPLIGTLAENVLTHGVGGLNIKGCRIPYGDPSWPGPNDNISGLWDRPQTTNISAPGCKYKAGIGQHVTHRVDLSAYKPEGRWPANIYMAPKPGTAERQVNHHPTLKPLKLMRWLCRLVTPPGGLILEPFAGSGTTLIAGDIEGFRVLAIEREPTYADIIRYRYNQPS